MARDRTSDSEASGAREPTQDWTGAPEPLCHGVSDSEQELYGGRRTILTDSEPPRRKRRRAKGVFIVAGWIFGGDLTVGAGSEGGDILSRVRLGLQREKGGDVATQENCDSPIPFCRLIEEGSTLPEPSVNTLFTVASDPLIVKSTCYSDVS